MSVLLRTGVVTAAALVAMGAVWHMLNAGKEPATFRTFHGEPAHLTSVAGVVSSLFSGDSHSLIQFGIVLLIATPIARVVFGLIAFALQRDRIFVVVSLIVLSALLYGFVGR